MKKLQIVLVLSIVFVAISPAFSQDDIYQTIANETCECINKKKVDLSNKKDAQIALGLCLIESATKNELEMDLTSEENMRALGAKIGVLMVGVCPDVFSAFTDDAGEDEETAYESVTGIVKAVEVGDFYYLVVKESSGKEHRFTWFQYFPGSDDFVSDPKILKGKKVTVYYQTWEVFSPVSKNYYNNKEIRELVIE